MQSKQLTEFYREYSAWLDSGAPENAPFKRTAGLCYSIKLLYGRREVTDIVRSEMSAQFCAARLDRSTPFNSDVNTYADESDTCSIHLNPQRIQWVKDHTNG